MAAVKKNTIMKEEEVIDLIRAAQRGKSVRAFAEEIGVSPAYISDILNGKRSPGGKVLKYFKVGKTRRTTVEYVFFRS